MIMMKPVEIAVVLLLIGCQKGIQHGHGNCLIIIVIE